MNFVGIKLQQGKPLEQEVEEGIILQLANFALVGPCDGVTQVCVESDDTVFTICNLSWPNNTQYATDVSFTDQMLKVMVKGNGIVDVTGSFSLDQYDFGGSEDDDDLMDLPSDLSDSDDDADDSHPAYAGKTRIEVMEEDSSSSSDDSEPPVKQQQQAQPKKGGNVVVQGKQKQGQQQQKKATPKAAPTTPQNTNNNVQETSSKKKKKKRKNKGSAVGDPGQEKKHKN